jgi:hypothetical protein
VFGCYRQKVVADTAPAAGRPRCRRPWPTPPWPGSPPVSLGVPSSRGALGFPFLRPLACRVVLGRASRPDGLYRGADESLMRPTANWPTPATLHRSRPPGQVESAARSRPTDWSEVFLPESSLSSVSNLSAQIPREVMPSRASPRPASKTSRENVVRSMVLEGGAWGPHSLTRQKSQIEACHHRSALSLPTGRRDETRDAFVKLGRV